jgi:hypothetical protein
LTALLDSQIIWKGIKGILHYLDSRQREALYTFMNQRTSKHARHTALAFFDVNQKISFRDRDGHNPFVDPIYICQHSTSPDSDYNIFREFQKISAGYT